MYVSAISSLLNKEQRDKLEALLRSRRSPSWPEGSGVLALSPPQATPPPLPLVLSGHVSSIPPY